MAKRILTLDDLYTFCASNNLTCFSAAESGYQLCVTVPATFEQSDTSDGLTLFGKVKLFHTNANRNGSSVTKEAAERCLPNIKYKPVLANFCEVEDENGEMIRDFTSHDMIQNDDGTTTYLERQVGCFTADEPILEYDEEHDRYYAVVGCAIPREYTDAADIIERKGGTKISAELLINQMSYDAQSRLLVLEDVDVAGGTLLGKNPETGADINEGMEGARVDIADFSAPLQTFVQDPTFIRLLESINDTLTNINKNLGKEDAMTKFELLLAQYGKTVEDITFEYDGLSDEELEIAFSTAFAANDDNGIGTAEDDNHDDMVEFAITKNGETKTFSLSLNDKIGALRTLVNETYADIDGDYYDVVVYEEDEHVDMFGYCSGKSYRQSFKCKKKTEYTLVGDRVETHPMFLTDDEIAAFENMKARYAELEEYHDKKEFEIAHAERMNVLVDYEQICETEEYKALVANIDAYTKEEITEKADAIVGRYARSGKMKFDAESKAIARKISLPTAEPKNPKSYSGLFDD